MTCDIELGGRTGLTNSDDLVKLICRPATTDGEAVQNASATSEETR
jgi:hypothetical protein